MDIPKVVAELRSELKLVEASIHVLEQTGQSKETFTEAITKCRTREIARKTCGRTGDETGHRRLFRAF